MGIVATHGIIDVVYSSDEGGYYAHDTDTDRVSPVYAKLAALVRAIRLGNVVWDD